MRNCFRLGLLLLALIGMSLPTAAQPSSQTLFLPMLRLPEPAQNPLQSGVATYYLEADGTGNCLFDRTSDILVAAMNTRDYNNAALCGGFVEIYGPNATITVRIVDQCPDCLPGQIDLSPPAFDLIAARELGRVPITWRVVSPALAGSIAYRFKDGSNQWWTAVQIRNHRNPIAKVEYQASNGQFVALVRQEWNYFLKDSGMGPGPYTLRVTDWYGNQLLDSAIRLPSEAEILGGYSQAGTGQFPPGP